MRLNGKILRGVGGLYTVATPDGEYSCGCRGIFRNRGLSPVVGDFVLIDELNGELLKGTIVEIMERKNELTRPRVSNIDVAFIVFSIVEPAINAELLDKFLVMAEYSNIEPVLCFTKHDLLDASSSETHGRLVDIYAKAGYSVVSVSTVEENGMSELEPLLTGNVALFAGPSGVGKSSLANALLKTGRMETGELSVKISRGKHTTRHAELLSLPGGGFFVDTPGFTTLEINNIEKESLPMCFREFRPFLDGCRFRDCMHVKEPDCFVKEHVGGDINIMRYKRYVSFTEAGTVK